MPRKKAVTISDNVQVVSAEEKFDEDNNNQDDSIKLKSQSVALSKSNGSVNILSKKDYSSDEDSLESEDDDGEDDASSDDEDVLEDTELATKLLGIGTIDGQQDKTVGKKRTRMLAFGGPSSGGVQSKKKKKKTGGFAIQGGYVYKEFIDSPQMQKLIAEANKLFFDMKLPEAKLKIQEIATEMGGFIFSREVFLLLANIHTQEGNHENAAMTKYFCYMRLGAQNVNEFKSLIYDLKKNFPHRKDEVYYLCKKAVAQRYQDSYIYCFHGKRYEEKGNVKRALDAAYIPAFRMALQKKNTLIDFEGVHCAKGFYELKKWDECCKILDYCVQRSQKLCDEGKTQIRVDEKTLLLFGELLCLHMRDFRKCADLYLKAWTLAKIGQPKQDVIPVGPGATLRKGFGFKDAERLSWLAVSLIQLGRFDEVNDQETFRKGSAESECLICVEAVNSIVDRCGQNTASDDWSLDAYESEEKILHNIVDALMDQKKLATAKRILLKLEKMYSTKFNETGNTKSDSTVTATNEKIQLSAKERALKKQQAALQPDKQELAEIPLNDLNLSQATQYRLGEVAYFEKNYKRALELLEPLLDNKKDDDTVNTSEGGKKNDEEKNREEGKQIDGLGRKKDLNIDQTSLRVHLAEIYVLNEEFESDPLSNQNKMSNMLINVNYDTMRHMKKLPPARSKAERESAFIELRQELQNAYSAYTKLQDSSTELGKSLSSTLVTIASAANSNSINMNKEINRVNSTTSNTISRASSKINSHLKESLQKSSYRLAECLKSVEYQELPRLSPTFVSRFMYLIYDCELDHERAIQSKGKDLVELDKQEAENISKKTGTSRDRMRYVTINQKKRTMALESVEDIYGSCVWLDFVRFGCEFAIAGLANRMDLAIDLLETVIINRRLYLSRSTITSLVLPQLEKASLLLSLQTSGAFKVAFKHIRAFAIRQHQTGFEIVHEGMLGLFGRLFASTESQVLDWTQLAGPAINISGQTIVSINNNDDSTNVNVVNDNSVTVNQNALNTTNTSTSHTGYRIVDYQKWACRHVCTHTDSWGLIMLVAHCSTLSGRPRFASAEYERAVAACPNHPLSYLCLATSQISLAMSRTVRRRHTIVLQGLLAMRKYQELRAPGLFKNSNTYNLGLRGVSPTEYAAETWYNVGRAHHQLGIMKYAILCYEMALDILTKENEADLIKHSDELSVNVNESGSGFSSLNKTTSVASIQSATSLGSITGRWESGKLALRPDRLALQRACAYNLHLIYANAGNLKHAAGLLRSMVVIE